MFFQKKKNFFLLCLFPVFFVSRNLRPFLVGFLRFFLGSSVGVGCLMDVFFLVMAVGQNLRYLFGYPGFAFLVIFYFGPY